MRTHLSAATLPWCRRCQALSAQIIGPKFRRDVANVTSRLERTVRATKAAKQVRQEDSQESAHNVELDLTNKKSVVVHWKHALHILTDNVRTVRCARSRARTAHRTISSSPMLIVTQKTSESFNCSATVRRIQLGSRCPPT